MRARIILAAIVGAMVSQSVYSQAPADTEPVPQQESAFVRLDPEDSEGAGSILGDIVGSAQNRLGFSFAAHGTYTPRGLQIASVRRSRTFGNFHAGVFTNFPRRRGTLSLNYSFGLRTSSGVTKSAPVHTGGIHYSRQLTRNMTLNVADTVMSAMNDYAYDYANPLFAVTQALPVFASEVFVDRQRIIRNRASANVNYQASQKSSIFVSAAHTTLAYELFPTEAHGLQAGIGGSYQLTRWMTLGTQYTNYFSRSTLGQNNSLIHRLQLADFGFDLGWNVRLASSGGIEYAQQGGGGTATTGVRVDWSRSSESSSISLNYHRGFSSPLGPNIVLISNDAVLAFNQRLGDRIGFQLGATATDGSAQGAVSLRNIWAGGGFDVLIVENLVASANAGYAFQKTANLGFNAANLSRYTATVGVTYVIPAIRGR